MSFILEPGTIPHIQHLYQPSKDWDIGSGLAIELLNMVNTSLQTKTTAWQLGISHKIDDRVSMKVAKISGEYYVGYKGLNSPLLDTVDQIEFLYRNKQYIREPLMVLLRNAKDIIPEYMDNIEVQVGVLWHSYLVGLAPQELKPNVVKYNLKRVHPTTEIIISIISATRAANTGLFFERDLRPFSTGSQRVFVLDTKVDYARSRKSDDHEKFIQTVSDQRDTMLKAGHFDVISGYEGAIASFFNWRVRRMIDGEYNGTSPAEFLDWYKSHHVMKNVLKLKKEINQKKKFMEFQLHVNYIQENAEAFRDALFLATRLNILSNFIREEVEKASLSNFTVDGVTEGIVLTYPYDNNKLVIFKIVPQEFSVANFKQNKDLYK